MSLKSARALGLALLLGVALAVGLSVWGYRVHEARTRWAAARPEAPDLSQATEPLRQRIEACEHRLSSGPAEVASLRQLGRLYLANGYQREAEHVLRSLLVYAPREPRWPHHLAGLLAGYGRLDEAIPLWRKVIELDPAYVPARLKLGDALIKSNRAAEARDAFAGVLAREPKNAYALAGLARLDMELGRWSAARREAEQAIEADPGLSAAHSLLATIVDRLGDKEAAAIARERSSALGRFKDVEDPWAAELVEDCYDVYRLQVLASSLSATGAGQEAIPILERARSLAPADARTTRQLAKLLLQLHEVGKAREQYLEAVRLDPREPEPYLELASLQRATNDPAGHMQWLQRGLASCPESAALHYQMAVALEAAGQLAEALEQYREARRIEPDNLTAYREGAVVAFKLGRDAEAVEFLEAGLKRDATSTVLRAMLARYRSQTK